MLSNTSCFIISNVFTLRGESPWDAIARRKKIHSKESQKFLFPSITKSFKVTIVTLNVSGNKRGSSVKKLPFAFTEQGVAMLASVLRSDTAVRVSLQIMDAFVAMRYSR